MLDQKEMEQLFQALMGFYTVSGINGMTAAVDKAAVMRLICSYANAELEIKDSTWTVRFKKSPAAAPTI